MNIYNFASFSSHSFLASAAGFSLTYICVNFHFSVSFDSLLKWDNSFGRLPMHKGNNDKWKRAELKVGDIETMIKHPWQVDHSNSFRYIVFFICSVSFFFSFVLFLYIQTKPMHEQNWNWHAALFELIYFVLFYSVFCCCWCSSGRSTGSIFFCINLF